MLTGIFTIFIQAAETEFFKLELNIKNDISYTLKRLVINYLMMLSLD